ncbi:MULTISPECIES: response regulator [unclassified Halomonas]|uniref:response regulator n=1 Tax=unclassified Halomonas TaxID=2609666 RepID=UPI001EF476B1|nr:response regulator [Halomonas sp. MMH1-48]MCG7605298.1 response regulator [Halomonas sp. MM17-34]MCG7614485.1 response regulator [Halomonas sp. MM17-29]MCG7621387.1 response regulator [Halomonas sp. DSH1-27]
MFGTERIGRFNGAPWYLGILFACLLVAGVAGNMLQLSVLFNVFFVFGSVAVMLAVAWLGTWPAVLIGVASGVYTYVFWENPVTVMVFILEALVVSWLYHHKVKNLIIAALIFWTAIAAPIDFLLLPLWLGWSQELTLLVYLKQAINGVFNAVIASAIIIVCGLSQRSWLPTAGALLRLKHLLFCALLSVTLMTGIPLILYEGHAMRQGQENFVNQTLNAMGNELVGRLSEPGADQRFVYHIGRVRADSNVNIGLLDAEGELLAQVGHLNSLTLASGDELIDLDERMRMWLPGNLDNPAVRFSQGFYTLQLPARGVGGVDHVLLETPALPTVRAMEAYRTVLFAMLAAVLIFGIVAAELLSRMITQPLTRLGKKGRTLSDSIAKGKTPKLPDSRIVEFQQLSNLLGAMSAELSDAFKRLRHTQSNLEREVDQRTRALASSNDLLSSVLDAAVDFAIIAMDTQGVIKLFNKGAEDLLGYQASEVIGVQTPMLFHDADEVEQRLLELSQSAGHTLMPLEVFTHRAALEKRDVNEWTYLTRAGDRVPIKLVVTAIKDQQGTITGYLGIAEDISESKRVEQMKNEFVSTVSHELRTPLTSISGALGMVAAGALGSVPDTVMRMVNIAHKNSQRLTHLINDLLDIEKIAAGKLAFDMQWQPLQRLLESAIEENRHYRHERQVTLTLDNPHPDTQVRVDGQRLRQVMANLLSNAVKFSPEGGEVQISVDKQDHRMMVTVKDDGPGIPDHFKGHIFSKFAQVDASDSRAKGGTGLGLAITRELIEHMEGEMGFDSEEGKGSCFWFSLPLHPSDTLSDSRGADAGRVLVIEDDPSVVRVLFATLAQAGFEVDSALDGAMALEKLANQHYDAITVDIGLPDMSGFDVIHALRQQRASKHTPVMVVTGSMERGGVALEGHLEDIAWLAKPIQTEHLLALLSEQMQTHQERLRLLHIEDDPDLHAVIRAMLDEHAVCDHAVSVAMARRHLAYRRYDAIILDIGLPDGEGWDLLEQIREEQPHARIIILSGQSISEADQHRVETVFLKSRISPTELLEAIQQRTQLVQMVDNE